MRQRDRGGIRRALALAVIGLAVAALPGSSQERTPECAEAVLASVGDEEILESHVRERARGRLARLRAEEYRILRQVLDEEIDRRLLEGEAAERGVSLSELLRSERDGAEGQVEDSRGQAVPPDEEVSELAHGLGHDLSRERHGRERRLELIRELRDRGRVSVFLQPPRFEVTDTGAPARGPADAPVTIVEFSNFRCPDCRRALPTVDTIERLYGDRVRFVFRNFPLSFHPQAVGAAEAGACAHEQGRFWEMRRRMFEERTRLQVADLKRLARELGLDTARFAQCLDSHRYSSRWRRDVAEGSQYGVTGAPAYFINGRRLVGAQSLESFTAIIDEELEHAGGGMR